MLCPSRSWLPPHLARAASFHKRMWQNRRARFGMARCAMQPLVYIELTFVHPCRSARRSPCCCSVWTMWPLQPCQAESFVITSQFLIHPIVADVVHNKKGPVQSKVPVDAECIRQRPHGRRHRRRCRALPTLHAPRLWALGHGPPFTAASVAVMCSAIPVICGGELLRS